MHVGCRCTPVWPRCGGGGGTTVVQEVQRGRGVVPFEWVPRGPRDGGVGISDQLLSQPPYNKEVLCFNKGETYTFGL